MDPVSLVTAALVAGAAGGLQDGVKGAASDTVGSLYQRLKQALTRSGGELETALVTLETEPLPAADLRAVVERSRVATDPEVAALAHALLAEAERQGANIAKYQVEVTGGQGTVVGDNATVTQHFGH